MKTFKMKIFTDFIAEARKERRFVTKAEAQAKFDKLPPEEQEIRVLRNAGQKHGGWGTKMKYSLKKQQKKRFETLKPLKKDDFVQAARRDLSIKNTEVQNVAKKAYDLEKATKRYVPDALFP